MTITAEGLIAEAGDVTERELPRYWKRLHEFIKIASTDDFIVVVGAIRVLGKRLGSKDDDLSFRASPLMLRLADSYRAEAIKRGELGGLTPLTIVDIVVTRIRQLSTEELADESDEQSALRQMLARVAEVAPQKRKEICNHLGDIADRYAQGNGPYLTRSERHKGEATQEIIRNLAMTKTDMQNQAKAIRGVQERLRERVVVERERE